MGAAGPYLPSLWTSLWTGMSALFQAAGAIIIGWLADRFGRKWPSCSAAVVTMIGTVLQYVAVSRVVLLWGKMITGLGVGALMATGATYISEFCSTWIQIAPPSLRAPLQTGLVVFVLFTQGAALGVVRSFVPDIDDSSFRMVFAIQWIVGGISLVAWAVAPESPIWLARKGRMQAEQNSMERIYGRHNRPNERLAYELQTLHHEAAKMGHGSYAACFQGTDLKRTLTSAFLFSTSNIGGGSFLSQNIYFLITAGLEAIHAFDVGVGGFALALVFIVGSGFYLQHISRRNVVLIGLSLNLVFMAIIGALYWASGKGPLWAIAVLMNILISVQSSTLQAAGWPIAAEVPSLRLRAKTLSIGIFAQTFTTWLFNFVTPYMYNVDSGNLGARTGLIYAGTSVALLVVAWRLVPDVTDMTTEEIDRAYETGVSPSAFQKQKVNSTV
ncbi:hypothetical protein G7054_g11166 [Neopestalotiopsis clavispora]|nr:hypothetical protein G7054_g11166 [Neopestalotiopsis clavispora]